MDNARRRLRSGPPLLPETGVFRLTDSVVELRPLAVVDAAEHVAGQDDEWRRWLGSSQRSLQGTLAWLCRCEEGWRQGGPLFAFGIRGAGRPGLLGTVELQIGELALPSGHASISCGLYPSGRGRGVAVRACRLASRFALRRLAGDPWNVEAVVAQIDPFNGASLQMIERAGFVYADSCVGAGEAWELFAMDLVQLEHTGQLAFPA